MMFSETNISQNFQNNSYPAPTMEWSVNYFGTECQLFWRKVLIILIILRQSVFLKNRMYRV